MGEPESLNGIELKIIIDVTQIYQKRCNGLLVEYFSRMSSDLEKIAKMSLLKNHDEFLIKSGLNKVKGCTFYPLRKVIINCDSHGGISYHIIDATNVISPYKDQKMREAIDKWYANQLPHNTPIVMCEKDVGLEELDSM